MEALGGVFDAKTSQDSTKMGQECARSKVPGTLQSGLTPPGRILDALEGGLVVLGGVLEGLERVLEALGGVSLVLEGVLEALGGVSEAKMSQGSQERAKSKTLRKLPSG